MAFMGRGGSILGAWRGRRRFVRRQGGVRGGRQARWRCTGRLLRLWNMKRVGTDDGESRSGLSATAPGAALRSCACTPRHRPQQWGFPCIRCERGGKRCNFGTISERNDACDDFWGFCETWSRARRETGFAFQHTVRGSLPREGEEDCGRLYRQRKRQMRRAVDGFMLYACPSRTGLRGQCTKRRVASALFRASTLNVPPQSRSLKFTGVVVIVLP